MRRTRILVVGVALSSLIGWTAPTHAGTSGGIVATANLLPADPGSGTGGVAVTSVQSITNYNYNGIGVTTINGVPVTGTPPDDTAPPPVITVSATPATLWPPNGSSVPVVVSGQITANGTGVNPQTAAYTVTDSYGQVQPTGPVVLNLDGSYSFNILLPAYRDGTDLADRNFTITVSGQDNAGNAGSSSFRVVVPHDQRK